MKRRSFLAASGVMGMAPAAGLAAAASSAGSGGRDYYELRQYQITEEQKAGFDTFMSEAAIPALNRIGVTPVGVFYPTKEISPIYVVMRHKSLESVATATQKLLADAEFVSKGAAFLDAPAEKPAFQRVESSLMMAFKGMPEIETPVKAPGRVIQLRIYESPSVKTGQKKIEMFNDAGEIAIFRKVGLNPVFFGETLVGAKMPNLTYMLVFENDAAQKAGWKNFGGSPEWQKLRGIADYADKKILCGITNLILKPAAYSQI